MKVIHAAAFLIVLAAPRAHAQIMNLMSNGSACTCQTVSANFLLSEPAQNAASSSDLANMMARATPSLYDIINRECDVLSVALKGACRVIQMNVGANINNFSGGRGPVVSVNANARFEITPTAPSSANTPTTPSVVSPSSH